MKKKFIKPEIEFDGNYELIDLICEKIGIEDIPLKELRLKFKNQIIRGALIEEAFYNGNKKEINLIIEIWNRAYNLARDRFEIQNCWCGELH